MNLEQQVIKKMMEVASKSAEKNGYTDDLLSRNSFISGYVNSSFESLLYDLNLTEKQQEVLKKYIDKV